jgi:hypothetical protein
MNFLLLIYYDPNSPRFLDVKICEEILFFVALEPPDLASGKLLNKVSVAIFQPSTDTYRKKKSI